MKSFKSFAALFISALMVVESVPVASFSAPLASSFSISLPGSLGYVSETYVPAKAMASKPDVILIQDLHANRSVQFSISGILKRLKAQNLLPNDLAVEGAMGPVEIKSMQVYPDAALRKKAADYLVEQGEMTGPMHFAVAEGVGGLYGIETDAYYKANLEMFRRSYNGRTALRTEIQKIEEVLPRLKRDAATRDNAAVLEKELVAVNHLLSNQVIPDELPATLGQANAAIDHLKLVLPKESAQQLVEPVAAAVDFYALALLRDEELFKNTLAVREQTHQTTTVAITGGFHTKALAEQCKRQGLSYAVITPVLTHNDSIDETLYVSSLFDKHLTPAQVRTGEDWTASKSVAAEPATGAILGLYIPIRLFASSMFQASRGWRPKLKHTGYATLVAVACVAGASCGGNGASMTGPSPITPGVTIGTGSPSRIKDDNGMHLAWTESALPVLQDFERWQFIFPGSSGGTSFYPKFTPAGQDIFAPMGWDYFDYYLTVPINKNNTSADTAFPFSVLFSNFKVDGGDSNSKPIPTSVITQPGGTFTAISGSNAFGHPILVGTGGSVQSANKHADFLRVERIPQSAALEDLATKARAARAQLAQVSAGTPEGLLARQEYELASQAYFALADTEDIAAGRPLLQRITLNASNSAPVNAPVTAPAVAPSVRRTDPAQSAAYQGTPIAEVMQREFPKLTFIERLSQLNPFRSSTPKLKAIQTSVQVSASAQPFKLKRIGLFALMLTMLPAVASASATGAVQLGDSVSSLGHGAFFVGLGIYASYSMMAVLGTKRAYSGWKAWRQALAQRAASLRIALMQFVQLSRVSASAIADRFSGPLVWIENLAEVHRRARAKLGDLSVSVLTAA